MEQAEVSVSVVTHIFEFLQVHWTWMLLGTLATMVLSGLCFGVACLILVRLPQTYFSEPRQSVCRMRTQVPALHGLMIAIKNICGALILALGMVLAIPGSGLRILIALLGRADGFPSEAASGVAARAQYRSLPVDKSAAQSTRKSASGSGHLS